MDKNKNQNFEDTQENVKSGTRRAHQRDTLKNIDQQEKPLLKKNKSTDRGTVNENLDMTF
jgi:hypothetical protein